MKVNAVNKLEKLSTKELIKQFDITENMKISLELSVVGLWMN